MRTFKNTCAQGDILMRKVNTIPKNAVPVGATDGRVVITHSETGHDHVMVLDKVTNDVPAVEMFSCADNPLLAWIKVSRPTALEHRRPHDTHDPIMFEPGIYEVRRQREHTPDGWRQVAD